MGKIEIPEGVIDKKSYLMYVALKRNPMFLHPLIETSEGETINPGEFPNRIRKKIEHLPPKEQELIMAQKVEYLKLLQKKNVAKGKAFGRIGRPKKDATKEISFQDKAEKALDDDIVVLLGRLFSIREVVRIIAEDNGIAINAERVKRVLKENVVQIEKAREEFRNKVTDVRLYNKRPRLEELAWMYSKMKLRYIAMDSTDAYNAMLRTLEQIRKEAEGDIININGNVDVNLNVELQAHIQKEIIKTINLKEIILGRVAARMNFDTSKLIAGLHNSYYNRFVQISGDYDPTAEMQYPSLINYDFADIERKNAERDDITDIEPEPETEEEQSKAKGIRELFLQKIRKQKEEYEQRTSTAVTEEEIRREEAKDDVGEYERKGQHKRYDSKLEKEQRNEYHFTEESKARQKQGAVNSNKVQAIKRAMQRNSKKK